MPTALIVPTLMAGPFRLRPFTLADIDAVREASGDPLIPLITTVPAAFTEDEGRRFIERQWSRAGQGTGYSFAIADADTDRGVGQIGLWLKDLGEGRASIGYWVVRSARGRQVAATALKALALWGLHDLQIPRLELYVEPWNTASVATAERAGFSREGSCGPGKKSAARAGTCTCTPACPGTRFRRLPEQHSKKPLGDFS